MDTFPQVEPTTTASLLACLGLAIDETKLINSIKVSRKMIRDLEAENPSSERLIFLRKEVSSLEARLVKTRSEAGIATTTIKLRRVK